MAQIDKPNLHFNPVKFTGNASTNAITGVGFQPDWTWLKNLDAANSHSMFDAVRGVTKNLVSNTNAAESTNSNGLTAFGTDGFTVGSDTDVNGNGNGIISWNWKANGQGSANTQGTTNSTYTSANTTAGFSIVKYTGTGAGATVGHGLGVKPKVIFFKNLSANANWVFQSTLLANRTQLVLNSTDGQTTDSRLANLDSWSTTLFSLGTYADMNENNSQHIAFVFAEKKGYSKFGLYTGNGDASAGPFVYLGFKPAFVMVKRLQATGNSWRMFDNKRDGINGKNGNLHANLANAEDAPSDGFIDLLSNGFKPRTTSTDQNADGGTYFFMALAENPIVGSNGIPVTAR